MTDRRETILLVDDDDGLRYATARALREEGFAVREAASGADALRLVAEHPDLVLLDVDLPDVDGFAVCRRLKTNPATAAIPVAHLSAMYRTAEDRIHGLEAGADAYLVQPIEPRELIAVVRAMLRARRAEAALLDSQARLAAAATTLRGVIDAMPVGVVVAEAPDGRIVFANSTAGDILGAPVNGTARGPDMGYRLLRPDGTPFPPDDLPLVRALAKGEVVEEVELRVRNDSGRETTIVAGAAPIHDAAGRLTSAVATITDISERKHTEETQHFLAEATNVLSASLDYEATLRSLARLAVPAIADCCLVDLADRDGAFRRVQVAHWDPAQEAVARAVRGDAPFRMNERHPIAHVIRTGRAELIADVSDTTLHEAYGGQPFAALNVLRPASAMIVPLAAQDRTLGAITFVATLDSMRRYTAADLAVAEDLGRRAGLAMDHALVCRELQEADRRKDEFLATLGHELRNPLAPILNAVDVLDRLDALTPEARPLVAIVGRQARVLRRLVDDLLDLARIRSGKIALERRPVDLNDVARRCIESLRASGRTDAERVAFAVAPVPLVVEGDAVRLEQVFANLVDNALKYTPPAGAIGVSLEQAGDQAIVRVRDEGIGIDPAMLGRIFDLFTQAEPSPGRVRGGLGLGLPLVRTLIEQHGGTVSAVSEGRGRGSEFTVRLPLARDVALSVAEVHAAPVAGSRRVLVVEDNDDAREVLRALLEIAGHHVDVAANGLAAVEKALGGMPDIGLIDIGLPGLDGYQVAQRLRATENGRHVRLVALTGYGQPEDRRRAIEAGFDAHLVKPVDPDELLRAIGG